MKKTTIILTLLVFVFLTGCAKKMDDDNKFLFDEKYKEIISVGEVEQFLLELSIKDKDYYYNRYATVDDDEYIDYDIEDTSNLSEQEILDKTLHKEDLEVVIGYDKKEFDARYPIRYALHTIADYADDKSIVNGEVDEFEIDTGSVMMELYISEQYVYVYREFEYSNGSKRYIEFVLEYSDEDIASYEINNVGIDNNNKMYSFDYCRFSSIGTYERVVLDENTGLYVFEMNATGTQKEYYISEEKQEYYYNNKQENINFSIKQIGNLLIKDLSFSNEGEIVINHINKTNLETKEVYQSKTQYNVKYLEGWDRYLAGSFYNGETKIESELLDEFSLILSEETYSLVIAQEYDGEFNRIDYYNPLGLFSFHEVQYSTFLQAWSDVNKMHDVIVLDENQVSINDVVYQYEDSYKEIYRLLVPSEFVDSIEYYEQLEQE